MKTLLNSLLLGLLCCCTTFSHAQSPAFPYNPDIDSNSFIDLVDLLHFLNVWNQQWSFSSQAELGDMMYYGSYQDSDGLVQTNWLSLPIGDEGQLLTVSNGIPKWSDATTILIEAFPCLETICPIFGCILPEACNFDAAATVDDGSCAVNDECGVCGGDGVPAGDCDCNGNVEDECGACGGLGIPAGDCDCNGNVEDECGVCGGSGIPAGDCDCNGNVEDECGVCGGSGIPAGDCDCNGSPSDECGVCGGSGIPAGDCDCNGNQLDECGVCGGSGIPEGDCDCNGNQLDECGVCNGDNECDVDACNPVDGYSVGDVGPAGGIIIYDQGYYEYTEFENSTYDCWRYIEVSLEVLPPVIWGCFPTQIDGLSNNIGSGEINTQIILGTGCYDISPAYATLSASSFNGAGMSDWFLPSPFELMILAETPEYTEQISGWGLGGYWSSYQFPNVGYLGIYIQFSINPEGGLIAVQGTANTQDVPYYVLPMRRF